MSPKWQLPDDPSMVTREYEKILATLDNPRHRTMLQTLIDHIRFVVAGDVDGVMRTMVAEPEFGMWGPTGDTGSKGRDAVYAKYSATQGGAGISNQTVTIDRFVIDDDTIVLEMTETRLLPWQLAKERGYTIDEEQGQYAVHRHCAVVIPFDDAGLMRGETNYGYGWPANPHDWERVPDEDVAADYRDWLQALVPG